MFKAPFSFTGRIRRMEYGLSMIIYVVVYLAIAFFTGILNDTPSSPSLLLLLLLLPLFWFVLAQGTKRCHDLGNSGWYQLIPFYGLFMLFGNGDANANKYGNNPKTGANYDWDFLEKEKNANINDQGTGQAQ
jgi:uncharacterized membrane protein YhaH (DUF805 family)